MRITAIVLWLSFLQPADVTVLLEQARSAIDQGRNNEAGRLLSQVLALQPGHAEALYLSGTVLSNAGRLEEAEQKFQEAVQADSGMVLAIIGLAETKSRLGQSDQAVEVLQGALRQRPGEPLASFHLAQLLARRQDYQGALKLLTAIPGGLRPPGFFEVLGRTHLSAGNLEAAQDAFMKELELHPESVRTLQTVSAIALKRGRKSEAWDFIARARRLAPNSAQVVFAFAGVSLENYLISEAITALRLLLLREPDHPEYLLMLGNSVLESATEFSKAAGYFARYVELRPGEALGHMMLGYAHYVNRDYDRAVPELERTLEIEPDFLEAEYYLAMIDFNRNLDEAATTRLEALLQRSPDHSKAHQTLGKIYLRQRRFEDAVTELKRAAELTGGNSDIHFNLSRAYTQLGDRAEAERQLAIYQSFKTEEEKRELEGRRLRFQELREQETIP